MTMNTRKADSAKPTQRRFTTKVERLGDAVVLRLSGSCTMDVADGLTEAMVKLAAESVPLILLELSELDFIESTGLGGIVAGYLRLRRNQGEVKVVAPMPAIKDLLDLTRLSQLFPVYKTIEEAMSASSRRPS